MEVINITAGRLVEFGVQAHTKRIYSFNMGHFYALTTTIMRAIETSELYRVNKNAHRICNNKNHPQVWPTNLKIMPVIF
jgi:hypothetical protein